jgi:hypothetical protein
MDDAKFADWMVGLLVGLVTLIITVVLKTAFGLAVKLTLWAMTKLHQTYPRLDSSMVVNISATAWCVVWLAFTPWLHTKGMTVSEAFWLLLIGGLIWGLAIGNQIKDEIALIQASSLSPFTQVVDLPPAFYQIDPVPDPPRPMNRALTVEQQEARFQQQFQGINEPSRVQVVRHRRLPADRM